MSTRAETAAATREALTSAASELLDAGGPDAVTLREVGALAGVSRSAPYRHFADKEALLTALAAASWGEVGDALDGLIGDNSLSAVQVVRGALTAFIAIGRAHPYLYRLMFTIPSGDPEVLVRAAGRAHELFLSIVAKAFGAENAPRYGALLLTNAHGIVWLELSGHLAWEKWQSTGDDLIETLIGILPPGS